MESEEIDVFFEENTQDEIDAFIAAQALEGSSSVDIEAVRALQQEEIKMAVADRECAEGYYDVYSEVHSDYEDEVIVENREILEELRELQGN